MPGQDDRGDSTLSLREAERTPEKALPPARAGDIVGGRYELRAELGRGGAGVVFRAYDRVADEIVALKLLSRSGHSTEALDRVRRELRAARKILHPSVVRIHDLIEIEDTVALSMELVEGDTLRERLQDSPQLTAPEIARLAHDLAAGLAAAHEEKVTHRDLKPANIILRRNDGRAVITDFGLSQSPTDSASQPREGDFVGTPLYMAPEQLERRASLGPGADVYAFGLILYETAAGQRPFEGMDSAELLRARRSAPVALARLRPDLPARLCRLVDRCLAVDPRDRFRDGVDLRDQLERRGRAKLVATGVVAVVSIALAAIGFAWRGTRHAWHPIVRSLTADEENIERAAVAPDGRHLAIASTRGGGSWDIWLGDLAAGTWKPLTADPEGDFNPWFIDDGRAVLFTSYRQNRSGLWRVGVEHPRPPELVVESVGRAAVSPDGRHVLYQTSRGHWSLLDLVTQQSARSFESPEDLRVSDVAISPDATRAVARIASAEGELYLVDLRTKAARYLRADGRSYDGAAFLSDDPSALVVSSRTGGASALWKVFLDERTPFQLTEWNGGDQIAPVPSRDGKQLFFLRDTTTVPVFLRETRNGTWRRITRDLAQTFSLAIDSSGTRLVDAKTASDTRERTLWTFAAPFQEARRLGALTDVLYVTMAADGDELLAVVMDGSRQRILLLSREGAVVREVVSIAGAVCAEPTLSKDHQTIVFAREGAEPGLFMVSRDGGELRALLRDPSCSPRFSPTHADEIAFSRQVSQGVGELELLDVRTGSKRSLMRLPEVEHPIYWDPAGETLYVGDWQTIHHVSARDGTVLEQIPSPGDGVTTLVAGPNGMLVVGAIIGRSRLMVIQNFGDAPR